MSPGFESSEGPASVRGAMATHDGFVERYLPGEMHGSMVEAEHLVRYAWVAPLAAGRRVLDAGCGHAHGCLTLAAGGASHVVGVDVAGAMLDAVRPLMPPAVRLESARLEDLPFPDGSFDLVVCFEAIEHVDDHDRALDELRRVLGPGGVLALSTPNRRMSPPGNPYHTHEYEPEEIEGALRARFEAVNMWNQVDWITSTILAPDQGGGPLPGLQFSVVPGGGEEPLYTVALAGDPPLASPPPAATAAGVVELRAWLEQSAALEQVNRNLQAHIAGLQQANRERIECQHRLIEAETEAARVPVLTADLARALEAYDQAKSQAEALARALDDHRGTISWRVTAPLRAVRRRVPRRGT